MSLLKKQSPQIDPRMLMLFGLMDTRIRELREEIKKMRRDFVEAIAVLKK